MLITVKHGMAVFLCAGGGEIGRLTLTDPVDVLLALEQQDAREDDYQNRRVDELTAWLVAVTVEHSYDEQDEEVWRKEDEAEQAVVGNLARDLDAAPGLVTRACLQAAQNRRLSSELAPALERVQWGVRGDPDTVDDKDLLSIGTWCLFQAMQRGTITVEPCANCGIPWISSASESPYCLRPTRGRWSSSCRGYKKDEAFRMRATSYRNEYKRLHAAYKRDRLSEFLWGAWKADNSPSQWTMFEEWKRTRRGLSAVVTDQMKRAGFTGVEQFLKPPQEGP